MGKQKPSSMTTVGELRKVVRGMRLENTDREDYRTLLQKNINIGMPNEMAIDAVKDMHQMRKETAYYGPIIDRYQGLIDEKIKLVRNSKVPLAPTQFPEKK